MGLSNSITFLERFPGLNVRSRAVPTNSNEAECVRPPENFLRARRSLSRSLRRLNRASGPLFVWRFLLRFSLSESVT